ncbi:hypothetical protein CAPTEDRAFT_225993 [Capitella teleta]|uniref:Uncharacterized protein n=1 Tax=Capitella teleta TaxID=283909 RepID=R7UCT3_CAPTE|nr:hypothetical protein CAPTEDRAFT_225993 [Capitella teleta]|eukprot:ELU04195.1 hypothetical protein CAPTEDRAFT_225993 [Capitella teleta]
MRDSVAYKKWNESQQSIHSVASSTQLDSCYAQYGPYYVIPDARPDPNRLSDLSSSSNPRGHTPSPPTRSPPWPPVDSYGQSPPPPKMVNLNGRPESVAVQGHEYEELPKYRNVEYDYADPSLQAPPPPSLPGKDSRPPSGCRSVRARPSPDNLADGVDGNQNTYRKRKNPLYESTTERRVSKVDLKHRSNGHARCSCAVGVVALIVALLAFILAVYGITRVEEPEIIAPATSALLISTPYQNQLEEAINMLENLDARYSTLREQGCSQPTHSTTPWFDLSLKLDSQNEKFASVRELEMTVSRQQAVITNLTSQLERVESDTASANSAYAALAAELERVRKMPGPPGAGNLSQCVFNQRLLTIGTPPSSQMTVNTPWVPATENEASNSVILGVECSAINWTQSFLNTAVTAWGQKYRCKCSGPVGDSDSVCLIYYWTCPLIS